MEWQRGTPALRRYNTAGEAVMLGQRGIFELITVLLVGLISAAVVIWPASRVCAKAGYSPWLGLVAVVPGFNLLLLWYLAIAEWPSRRAA